MDPEMKPVDPQAPMPEEETMKTPEEMPAKEEVAPAKTTEEVM